MSSSPGKFRFSIDRGGTFTDVVAEIPRSDGSSEHRVLKLLSEDPRNYADAPTEGIRRVLEESTGIPHPRGEPIDTSRIEFIRMGTTVATNALLERKGEKMALLTTKGFRDLLFIGNQSRPAIFDLAIQTPELLYERVIEVDERVMLAEAPGTEPDSPSFPTTDREGNPVRHVVGTTGDRFIVAQPIDRDAIRAQLQSLLDAGIRAIAVVLMHAYAWPDHEAVVGELAREMGFTQVSLSSSVMPMVKMVPRGHTSCADAYLTPHIVRYVNGFTSGFDQGLQNVPVLFMQSDGGLAPVSRFSGHRAILSGPAGGVVGYAMTTFFERESPQPVVGFDMGGTSTDVSRFDGTFEHVYETTTAGVTIQAPQLDINTVAAGGGSRLFFRNGLFVVGPESAGAHPGPVCYRKGGPLAVTDANLVLGRILPEHFPHIFGPEENEPLDAQGARDAFQSLTDDINAYYSSQSAGGASSSALSVEDVAYGFLKVANEAMCRPIRALTQMKGHDITKHILACFGGAGGQHACAIARSLGVKTIFVHRFSGILSAYGIGLADVVREEQEPVSRTLATAPLHGHSHTDPTHPDALPPFEADVATELVQRFLECSKSALGHLRQDGFSSDDVGLELFVHIRYQGTDTAMMTSLCPPPNMARGGTPADATREGDDGNDNDDGASAAARLEWTMSSLEAPSEEVRSALTDALDGTRRRFVQQYFREFGFTLRDRALLVDDVRVRAIGHGTGLRREPVAQASGDPVPLEETTVHFQGGHRTTPVFRLRDLTWSHSIPGPALLLDATSTILVEPGFRADVTRFGDVEMVDTEHVGDRLERAAGDAASVESQPDPILLSIFAHRFMSIAEQMGRTLQRTSISVNIKERLDFSCALFGPDGGLIANAPHIPVHLGAMQDAVRFQLRHWGDDLHDGDVLVSNHPQLAGGSHLPDITVMTPVFDETSGELAFVVASRGHHADIGGIAPGSMPPLSKSLVEEGAAIVAFKLVEKGEFQEDGIRELLAAPAASGIPGNAGARNPQDCLSDLRAQVAANQRGITLVHGLIRQYGLRRVLAYMQFIKDTAEEAVRSMLIRFAEQRQWRSDTASTSTSGSGDSSASQQRSMTVTAEDRMDDGNPIRLQVTVDETTRSAVFDFSGTGPEVFGNCNAPPAVTYSAVIYALRCLVNEDIPLNEGCLAPVKIILPEGSILRPSSTAAVVGGNVLTSQRVVDVVLKGLDAAAASQGCMNNLTFGDGSFGYYETICGGAGAGPTWHGRSGVHTHMTNTRITDPEILERRYPIALQRFHLRPYSGGDGHFRGGHGVVRDLTFRKPLTMSILSERRAISPFGMHGGSDGRRGANYLFRDDGTTVSLGGKNTVSARLGETLRILTPGGGGWGVLSEERKREQLDMEDSERTDEPEWSRNAFQSLSSRPPGTAREDQSAGADVRPVPRQGGGSLAQYQDQQHSA